MIEIIIVPSQRMFVRSKCDKTCKPSILVPGTFKFLIDAIKIIITVTIYERDVVSILNQEIFLSVAW